MKESEYQMGIRNLPRHDLVYIILKYREKLKKVDDEETAQMISDYNFVLNDRSKKTL